ncbi:tenascin X precursor [Apiospora kogelbergensis]|uniref:tenascin X precursor n=1 Tax=Apiospora kogelbergensis TaxID=1337665 RepID=UPI00312EB128
MARLKHVSYLFLLASSGRAQDPLLSQHATDVSNMMPSGIGLEKTGMLSSCLAGSPCQMAGKRITIDDIILSSDDKGNQKCCPKGTHYDGTQCVYPPSSVCPRDMEFQNGVCVLISGPTCTDRNLIPTKDGCVSRVPPQCPPTTTMKDGQCVLNQPPTCPQGYMFEGKCAIPELPICPTKGFYAKDGLCVSHNGPACQHDWLKVVGDKCVHVKEAECPKNTKLDSKGRCTSTQPPGCPFGMVPSGDRCIHSQGPSCPDGSVLQRGICVSKVTPSCTSGQLINGHCVDSTGPSCSGLGFRFNAASGFCQQRNDADCGEGFVFRWHRGTDKVVCCHRDFGQFDGITCNKPNPDGSLCPANSTPRDGLCVSEPGQQPICDKGNGAIINGQCITRKAGTCPHPLKSQNGKCVHPDPPYCGPDAKISPSGDECVLIVGPKCKDSTIPVGQECVSNLHTPECPADLKPTSDGMCVGYPSTVCPADTIHAGKYCVHPTDKPGCRGGTTMFNEHCVQPVGPTCPDGSVLQGRHCIALENPRCDLPGFTYSPTTGACVHVTGPTCNAPYQLRDGQCYSDKALQCPDGTARQGPLCVAPADCTGEYTLEGDRCVYAEKPRCIKAGTELDERTGECVSREETPSCAHGHLDASGRCVTQIICGPNLVPHGPYCVSLTPAYCERGFHMQDGKCVLETGPVCPYGYRASGTECVSTKPAECPPETYVQGDRCVVGATRECLVMGSCPEVGQLRKGSPIA